MVRVRLLGSLAIEVDGKRVEPPSSRRAQALLGWLALNPGMHARGTLAGRFWPDVLETSARQSLRSAAWSLRRALGPGGERALHAMREEIGLQDVATDLAEWEEHVAAGRFAEAIGLDRGELLAGLDDDWVLEARDDHRARQAEVLEKLAVTESDPKRAIEWTRRWAALDPLAEAPARALMQRLAESGDRSAALAVYSKLRERMRLELGASPSSETRRVLEEVEMEMEMGSASGLVGRRAELRRLLSLRGRGGVVLLSGEGGIGKTALATEVLRQSGARTAVGAALDIGGAAPFSLWAELLRELVRVLPEPPPDAAWPRDLGRLVPELGAPAAPAPPELERARLFEAAVQLFEWAAAEQPVAVLVDDLHLADPASIELFAYVGRRMPSTKALILATRREVPRREQVDAAIDALSRRGALLDEVRLKPLGDSEVEELVRTVAALDDAEIARIADVAEGNPLLAVESARAADAGEHGPPATLRASVRAQLATLDDEARAVAELLAVAGRELDRHECVAACDRDEDVAGATTAAAECGLLSAGGGRIGYRHGLLREAVYDALPDPRRAWLHERLAETLQASPAAGPGERDAEIARHLLLAGHGNRAVEHLQRAAAHARGLACLPEAAAFLREAIEVDPANAELWLELAEIEAWGERGESSDAAFDSAVALLDRGALEPRLDAWLRHARWQRGPTCSPPRALASYERALEIMDAAGADTPRQRAEALAGRAWCYAAAGDPALVDGALAEVHALVGDRREDDMLVHDIAAARQFAFMRAGQFAESFGPGIAAGEAAVRAGRPDMAYGAWGNCASAAAALGDLDRALEFAERSLYAVQGTCTPIECAVYSARAQILSRAGRLEEARAAAQVERDVADQLDRPDLAGAADYDLATIALAMERWDEAAALVESALALGNRFSRPLARLTRADALARGGRPDEAEDEMRAATMEPVTPGDFPATLVARLARVQGLIALARGDRELAERRLEEAASVWRRHASPAMDGEAYLANLVDFGRIALIGLVEPVYELRKVEAELEALRATVA